MDGWGRGWVVRRCGQAGGFEFYARTLWGGDAEPVLCRRIGLEQARGAVVEVDHDVGAAVIVEVAKGGAAAYAQCIEGGNRDTFETAAGLAQ